MRKLWLTRDFREAYREYIYSPMEGGAPSWIGESDSPRRVRWINSDVGIVEVHDMDRDRWAHYPLEDTIYGMGTQPGGRGSP